MRLPSFRVRTLMLATCAVALLVWAAMMGTRSYDYASRARLYAAQARGWRQIAVRDRGWAKYGTECVDYYSELARKYRRATWRPFLPVDPDPFAPGASDASE